MLTISFYPFLIQLLEYLHYNNAHTDISHIIMQLWKLPVLKLADGTIIKSLCKKFLLFFFFYTKSCQNISSYSFNDTDLSLGTHLHIGLKLCILTGNLEILIKSDLLTSIKILTSS